MEYINKLAENPYGKHIGNELKYVTDVLDSENRESRSNPYVGRLEDKFSKSIGAKYAIAHNSGTATLHTCLAAAGVGKSLLMTDSLNFYLSFIIFSILFPFLTVIIEIILFQKKYRVSLLKSIFKEVVNKIAYKNLKKI